jgi:tetratricopeptide (TPR) repeat protein
MAAHDVLRWAGALKDAGELMERGRRLELSGDVDGALEIYRTCMALEPDNPAAYSRAGALYARSGQRDEARRLFEEALSRDERYVPALTNMGALLLEEGRLEDAEGYLRYALSLEPQYGPAHRNLGVLLRRRGDIGGMVRELKAATRAELRGGGDPAPTGVPRSGCLGGTLGLFLAAVTLLTRR